MQVSTLSSHHQLQYLLPPRIGYGHVGLCKFAADDDLIELKLAQTRVALTGPMRQQVLQLMMT